MKCMFLVFSLFAAATTYSMGPSSHLSIPLLSKCPKANELQIFKELFLGLPRDVQEIIRKFLLHTFKPHSYLLKGHKKKLLSVALTPDAKWALTGADDKTARLWDLHNLHHIRSFKLMHDDGVCRVALSSDAQWALTAAYRGNARFWALHDLENIQYFELAPRNSLGQMNSVESLALTPDGKWALTGLTDGGLYLWDLRKLYDIRYYELIGHANRVSSVMLAPDAKSAMSASLLDGKTYIWDLDDLTHIRSHELTGHPYYLAPATLSSDAKWALTGYNSKANLSDLHDLNHIRTYAIDEHQERLTSLMLSPDAKWALIARYRNAFLWDLHALNHMFCYELTGHTGNIDSVALSPDIKWALTGSYDKTARLWHLLPISGLAPWQVALITLINKYKVMDRETQDFYNKEVNGIVDATLKEELFTTIMRHK